VSIEHTFLHVLLLYHILVKNRFPNIRVFYIIQQG